ncbi:hypothetical protein HDU96_008157 [Phlyctochytrium bullatum]|nr:hypothetical protein HDU96_008157 [Phlyctochytrium bullatum]
MDSVKEEAGASEALAETSYHLEGDRLHDDDKPRLSEASIPVFVVTSSEDQEQGESSSARRSNSGSRVQRSHSLSSKTRKSEDSGSERMSQGRRKSFQVAMQQPPIQEKLGSAPSNETIRQLRFLRAMGKRHDRTTQHLEKFIRIKVNVDRPPTAFTVVVDKTQTVEYLSHLIEAEYAFKYLLPVKSKPEDDYDSNILNVLPLECGLLYNVDMVSLPFEEKIEDVLDLDSELHVLNAFEGLQVNSDALPPKLQEAMQSFMEDVDDDTDDNYFLNPLVTAFRRSSIKNTFTTKTLPNNSGKLLEAIEQDDENGPSYADGAQGATDFQTSYANTINVEAGTGPTDDPAIQKNPSDDSILRRASHRSYRTLSMVGTTLDDRLQGVLRNRLAINTFYEFCIDDYSIENLLFWLSVECFHSCQPSLKFSYARFIFYTFISQRAPLRINLSQEVLRDIVIPTDSSKIDHLLFEEAQQHVYSILKGHTFVRFEKSQKIAELLKLRNADVDAYKKAHISSTYSQAFPIGDAKLRGFVEVFEFFPIYTDQENTKIRDEALNNVILAYFPDSKYLPTDGYFTDPARITLVKKKRRIQKEKKISKFFGERPSFEQLQRQLVAANLPQAGVDLPLLWASYDGRVKGSDEDGDNLGGGYVKRKKAEKLTEFFGQNLGRNQLQSQKLADKNDNSFTVREEDDSSSEVSFDDEPLETINELDPETKKQLTKRTKKLVSILGESQVHQEVAVKSAVSPSRSQLNLSSAAGHETAPTTSPDIAEDKSDLLIKTKLQDISGSFSSLTSQSTVERDASSLEREMRLKKLKKLSSFLGETTGAIGAAEQEIAKLYSGKAAPTPAKSPMTPEEKQVSLWRASKLEKVLGEVVPSNLVTTTEVDVKRRRSFDVQGSSLAPRQAGHRRLSELPSIFSTEFDEDDNTSGPVVPPVTINIFEEVPSDLGKKNQPVHRSLSSKKFEDDGAHSRRSSICSMHHENLKRISALLTDNKVDRVLDIMDQMVQYEVDLKLSLEFEAAGGSPTMQLKKAKRQRKLQKLNKFFGSKLNPVQLFEQSLVADIEKDIEDDNIDPGQRELLRNQLAAVREQILQKSPELKKGLEDRALRELNEESRASSSRPVQTHAF